jgi:hypothetical protein
MPPSGLHIDLPASNLSIAVVFSWSNARTWPPSVCIAGGALAFKSLMNSSVVIGYPENR